MRTQECYYFCRRDKFNTVSSVTIFVSDNYGADTTRINFIGFKGEFGKGKRRAVEAIYEVSGSAMDAKLNGTSMADPNALGPKTMFKLNKFSWKKWYTRINSAGDSVEDVYNK